MSSAGRPIPDPERMGTDQGNSKNSSNEAEEKQEKKQKTFVDECCEKLCLGMCTALLIIIHEQMMFLLKLMLTSGLLAVLLICV